MDTTSPLAAAPVSPPPARAHRQSLWTWLCLAVLVASGLGLRVAHIGRLGLVADEGHQALAVRGILDHGYPRVDSGNVYWRGAPFLYTEAAVALSLGVNETALRLPAALFGAAVVVATFFLGRRLFGTEVGLVAAVMVAFSAWGLEMARYARMYTLLQLAFVTAAFCFVKGYVDRQRPWVWGSWVAMALAIVTHQLGVMTLTFFLLPLFWGERTEPTWRRAVMLCTPALCLAALWLGVHREIGRWMVYRTPAPSTDAAPSGILGLVEGYLRIPQLTMPLDGLASAPVAVLGAAAVTVAFALWVAGGLGRSGARLRTLYCCLILAAAFFNLFALAIGLGVVGVLLFGAGWTEQRRSPWRAAWLGVLALAFYWAVFMGRHPGLLDPGWGEPQSINDAFFDYPPLVSRALEWFWIGWPRMTVVVVAAIVALLAAFAFDRRWREALIAPALVCVPLVVALFGRELFNEVRYHFHLYPFGLIVGAAALWAIAGWLARAADIGAAALGRGLRHRRALQGVVAVALVFVLSADASPARLKAVVGRDYESAKDPIRATLNWAPYSDFHQDHVAPAAYVVDRLAPGDLVMVFGPTYWASIYRHYIGQLDYVVADTEPTPAVVVRRHHVSGAPIVGTVAALDRALAQAGSRRIWLLGDLNLLRAEVSHFDAALKARLAALALPYDFIGRDANTLVRCLNGDAGRATALSAHSVAGSAPPVSAAGVVR